MKHLCSEEITAWVAGERRAAAERHLDECAQCAGEVVNAQNAIALFGESTLLWSAHLEKSVPRGRAASRGPVRFAFTLAACVIVALALSRPAAPKRANSGEPFVAFPYVAPLAPYERAQIQRMDIPVAALAAAGFQLRGPDTAGVVRADVLLGQDGRAYALRFTSQHDWSLIQ
uniref:Zinc-finger domain-containing protein n=1 Tax=Solibacter usitatus (strain Ellin6076) TaxID=234267 RepID=Q024P0_SOLUE